MLQARQWMCDVTHLPSARVKVQPAPMQHVSICVMRPLEQAGVISWSYRLGQKPPAPI